MVIGAGAAILGPFTVGAGSRIGSGSAVVKEVPPHSVVVGVPGRITHRDGRRVPEGIDLNMTDLPDPVARAIQCVLERLQAMEDEVARLKRDLDRAQTPAGVAGSLDLPAGTKSPN